MSTVLSNIVKKEELREVQLNTLEKIASVVGETAGPAGSYVMILNDGTNNVFTKDGHKALSSIKFHHPLERSVMSEIESSTGYIVKHVGDGTTAMTKLSYEVFKGLCEYEVRHPEIPKHMIINTLKRCIEQVQEVIRMNKRDLTLGDIYKICMISTDGNKEVSGTIAEIYDEYGADVFIELGISNTENHTIESFDGMTINRGYPSPAYINTNRGVCEIDHPRLYCFTDPVDDPELINLFQSIIFNNITDPLMNRKPMTPTVILAPKVSEDLRKPLSEIESIMYQFKNPEDKPPLCIITGFSLDLEFYNDLIMLTDAPMIKKYINRDTEEQGQKDGTIPTTDNITNFYGTCDRIVSDNFTTSFINPKNFYERDKDGNVVLDEEGNKKIGGAYESLVNFLKAELQHTIDNNGNTSQINSIKRRLHSLESNYVKYNIGGISSGDRDSVKDLAEDAILNCRSSALNGVGYGANFEGLMASMMCLGVSADELAKKIKDETDEIEDTVELDMYKIIHKAFKEIVLSLYTSVLGDKASVELDNSVLVKREPINLRTLTYNGDVLCSIETDISILEAISRIETMMFNTTQCLLADPNFNYYISDEDLKKDK